MKYSYLAIVLLFFTMGKALAQIPDWSVSENNFQYTMSYVSFLNIDGFTLASPNDKVACFVNGECRGVTALTYIESEDSYFAYLTAFANENSEIMQFKVYDSANNRVIDIENTDLFAINEHKGNLFQAFSIASPALSNKAEIINFSFQGVSTNNQIITDNEITLFLDKDIDKASLIPIIELDSGASIFIEGTEQISGLNTIDCNNPVIYQVVSEDQSVLKQWTLNVISSVGIVTYYKKDAVCYQGGVIKVTTSENEAAISLFKNDLALAVQSINNGEAIFSNLEVGTYKVVISGNVKEISINLKE